MLKVINQKISIDNKYLDSNIYNNILENLKSMEGFCTLKDGYILKVNRLIDVKNNIISQVQGNVIYNVSYEAIVLKPAKDMILKGKVCMVFEEGVFVDVKGVLKVLIPIQSDCEEYRYIENSFLGPEGDEIKYGTNLSIKITLTKNEKKGYRCIGTIENLKN